MQPTTNPASHSPFYPARGAVTQPAEGDCEAVVTMLGDALATELVGVLRHRRQQGGSGPLLDTITEDLVSERIAIERYRSALTALGVHDATTRQLLEGILAVEEEHADDLATLLSLHTTHPRAPGRP